MARLSIHKLREMKERGEKIPMVTAYDAPTARLAEQAGIPVILVGDSVGMVVLGYESTVPVTMEEMLHHTRAVVRGTERAIIVGDMPFLSYQTGWQDALRNAGRFLKEAGATAVKLEGGAPQAETLRRLVEAGIPVMGHIGLTPQSINQLGGYRVQGKTPAAAQRLVKDAATLEEAGAFALVLEAVPASLAKVITDQLRVPTIGIGAGPSCDGQVQVLHDMLGLFEAFVPRHVRRYAQLGEVIRQALTRYAEEVRCGQFPGPQESFGMIGEALAVGSGVRG